MIQNKKQLKIKHFSRYCFYKIGSKQTNKNNKKADQKFPKKTINLRSGFSLFELIIGLLISTILTTICFSIYQRIARTTQFVQKITTNDTKAMILKNRLQQDFLGIAPLWFLPSTYEEMIKKTSGTENTEEKSEDSKKAKADTQKTRENNFFYSTNNQDDTLNLFSFITTSSMQMYGTENKPYVRVVYSLKKIPTKENCFSLYRKELEAGEFNQQTVSSSGVFYEIASLIKKISIEYGFINNIKIQNTDEKKQEQSAEKPTEMTWLKTWEAKQEKTEGNVQKTLFPKCVKMKILFMQEKSDHEQEYEFVFIIPIDTITIYPSFTQKNYQKEVQKKAQMQSLPQNLNQNITPPNQQADAKGVVISVQPNQTGSTHAT